MSVEAIAVLIVVSVVSAVLGYVIARSRAASTEARLQQQIEQQHQQLDRLQVILAEKSERLESEEAAHHNKQTELAVVKQQLAGTTERCIEQAAELSQVRSRADTLQVALSEKEQALSSTRASLHASQERAKEQDTRYQQLRDELQQQRDKTSTVEARRAELAEELATLRTSQKDKEEHFAQQLKQLAENKVALKQEFENLANQIFEAKGKAFSEQSRQSLDALLNPFKQQINDFKAKVENVHLEGTKQQTEMRSELKQLQTMHQKMSQEAHDLATALKGQKKMQGNWGELVLENVLDRSGLQLGRDYKREVSFTTEEGGRSRPDVVVYLPQGKHLVIDAKVSLNAYTRFVNAEDELERQQAVKEHVASVAARIKELAERDYYRLSGINSPDMVFMFVPIESAFVEALKADETLFQKAIEQNVLVATPTTLLTSLNIVRQLWRFEDQNKHTAELARKAESVFKKLKTFLTSFEGVKKGLEKAQEAYVRAESQLVSGSGNLVKQVNEFKQLAPAIKDQLPEYFTEKAALELTRQLAQDDTATDIESEIEIKEPV